MSDPTDMMTMATHGATGLGGGAVSLVLVKFLFGGVVDGLKSQFEGMRTQLDAIKSASEENRNSIRSQLEALKSSIEETRSFVRERLAESKADMREGLSALKDQLERSERRHDGTLEDLGVLKQSSLAAHSRMDEHERRLESLERGK